MGTPIAVFLHRMPLQGNIKKNEIFKAIFFFLAESVGRFILNLALITRVNLSHF